MRSTLRVMVMGKEGKLFKLKGPLAGTSEGLRHLPPPPPIKGRITGVRPSVTFYFDTEEEKKEVVEFFRRLSKSRVPEGKELVRIVRLLKEGAFKEVKL